MALRSEVNYLKIDENTYSFDVSSIGSEGFTTSIRLSLIHTGEEGATRARLLSEGFKVIEGTSVTTSSERGSDRADHTRVRWDGSTLHISSQLDHQNHYVGVSGNVRIGRLTQLEVHSTPEGADVFIEGELKGTTPFDVWLKSETYTLTFEKEGYHRRDVDVTIDPEMTNKVYAELTEIEEPEPPENFWEKVKGIFSDVLFENLTIPDALIKWAVLPAWVGTILDTILDIFTVNVAPEGEPPLRIMFFGAGTKLATLPKISAAQAEIIVSDLTEKGASRFLAKATANPEGMGKLLLSLPEVALEKLLQTLSRTPTGKSAVIKVMQLTSDRFASKIIPDPAFQTFIKKAPKYILTFFGLLWAFKFIGFDIPGFVANFRKEIPEPAALGVWAKIEHAQTLRTQEAWQSAKEANELYLTFIDRTDELTSGFVSLNPWLKDIYLSSADAQRAQYNTFKTIIDEQLEVIEEIGTLRVVSNVDSSDVFIDGAKVGLTPFSRDLAAKTYHVLVTKFQHTSDEIDIAVIAEMSVEFSAAISLTIPPPPGKGRLKIVVEPSDAIIEVAGQPQITAAGSYELDIGNYSVRASKEGYYDKTITTIIKSEEETTLSITLSEIPAPPPPPPAKATVTINSIPQGAKIYIDGEYKFTTTPYTITLDPGSYLIRLELHGYETSEESISLAPDEVKTYTKVLTIVPIPPVPPVPPVEPPVVPSVVPPVVPPVVPAPPVPIPPAIITEPEERKLILNIETEGFAPWKHRLISIGIQDPSKPEELPTVIMQDDEAQMLNELFTFIKEGNYNELVVYGGSFDFRFIVLKAMKYGITCKEFARMDIYDLGQAMAQVKFKFVYFAQRQPKLSDIADYFWGYPKPFTDLEMIKYWKQGRKDKVLEFTSSQITRILLLYSLFRSITEVPITSFSSGVEGSKSFVNPQNLISAVSEPTTPGVSNPVIEIWKCPTCLQELAFPTGQTKAECNICNSLMKKL